MKFITEEKAKMSWREAGGKKLESYNAVVESCRIGLDRHVNAVVLRLGLKLGECGRIEAMGCYDHRAVLGVVVEDLIEMLIGDEGEFQDVKSLEGRPLRILMDSFNGPVRGIGSFLKDEFVVFFDYYKEKEKQVHELAHQIES
ncbi:MAG: hypothetical protein J6Y62_00165 [Clostridia bacterium]|nr:hypothetical protein [Clostridia bacterium]